MSPSAAAVQASATSAQPDELAIAGQARRLHGGVGGLGGLREVAAGLERMREADHHRHHELALPDRARERDAPAQVADGVVVVLAEVLGEAEVVGRVEAHHELVVGQRVEQLRGAHPRRLGGRGVAAVVLGEAQQPARQRLQAPVLEPLGGLQRPRRPVAHGVEVAVVERVGRELGVERGHRRLVAVAQRLERGQQAGVGGGVAAEQVLTRRAGRDQAHAQVRQVDQRERRHQRLERALEPSGRGERARERHEQPEAPGGIGSRVWPEQPQRGVEPAGGHGGRARRRLVAGLLEHRDGRLVAEPRRVLDVVCAGRERAGLRDRERLGRAAVGFESPALARPVVDRPPHERMAEAIAARHVARGGDAGGQQVLDRHRRLALAETRGRGREIEVERVARHRGAPGELSRGVGQAADLLPERGCNRGRHPDCVDRLVRRLPGVLAALRRKPLAARLGRRSGGPGELLEVERVAAARAEERLLRRGPEQRARLGLGERAEPDVGHQAVAAGGLERGEEAVGHLARAEGERDQQRARPADGAAGGRSARARRRRPSGRRRG